MEKTAPVEEVTVGVVVVEVVEEAVAAVDVAAVGTAGDGALEAENYTQ